MNNDTEPDFVRHRREAAASLRRAHTAIANVRAYTLADSDLSAFKDAHKNLRRLTEAFEEYLPAEPMCPEHGLLMEADGDDGDRWTCPECGGVYIPGGDA